MMRGKPCKCGHYENAHLPEDRLYHARCLKCLDIPYKDKTWAFVHEFQLDNLKYIEELAKERRLI
jgi:hypothetical protein